MSDSTKEDQVLRAYLKWPADTLEKEINRADRLYWRSESTGISDALFDALVTRLQSIKPDSVRERKIGKLDVGTKTVEHDTPMLSLRKVTDTVGVHKWVSQTEAQEFFVSPKVDGIACSVVYDDDGTLLYAATRGDGHKGELITKAVVSAGAVPDEVPNGPCEIRGELFISKQDFARMKGFSCARNAVAGFVKRNKPDDTFPLQFFPYDVVGLDSEGAKIEALMAMDFDEPLGWTFARGESIEPLFTKAMDDRPSWPFDADGLVIRVDTSSEFISLGATSHHPRGAIALKFPDEVVETTVTGFIWDVSRTGSITPVAKFAPCFLAGAEISRATLHHLGRYLGMGIGIGSKIVIARRGGVIPHVHSVVSTPKGVPVAAYPIQCPSCGCNTKVAQGVSHGAKSLQCPVPNYCPKVAQARVIHFAATVGIKGLGPRIAESLFERGLVRRLEDIYKLKDEPPITKWPTKTEKNLLASIETHREIPFAAFLAALGMDLLGTTTAKVIARSFDPITFLCLSKWKDLKDLEGVGELSARNIIRQITERSDEIDNLLEQVTIIETKYIDKGGKYPSSELVGAMVLFTGTLNMKRSEAIQVAIDAGAEEAKSVNKDLDFLIAADPEDEGSAKLRKATLLIAKGSSLQIISEDKFISMAIF